MRRMGKKLACVATLLPLALAGCSDESQGENRRPVAVAGPDQAVYVEQPAQLDGSQSFDPDGDRIRFAWSLAAAPEGNWTGLENHDTETPRLVPMLPGEYLVRLVVSDFELESEPDVVVIRADPLPVPCETVADCEDNNVCTDDHCDPAVGCSWTFNDVTCDDGKFCTAVDLCDGNGNCAGSGHPCPGECYSGCDEEQDVCQLEVNDSECGERYCLDGDWMRWGCQEGECLEGVLVETCDDGNECTLDDCQPLDGCQYQDRADLAPCDSGVGICCAITCRPGWECCLDADCGESNPCITYSCQEGQCSNTSLPIGAGCDGGDGNLCNHTCDQDLNCVDVPLVCDDGNPCNGLESCSSEQGICLPGTGMGAGTHCTGEELVECDDSENLLSVVSCPLGCDPDGQTARCYEMVPSNIDANLLCANQHGLTISSDAVIDTNSGVISGVPAGQLHFTSVSQAGGGPDIGVFSFDSLTVQSGVTVTVTGQNALALAVCTDVYIAGVIDASAIQHIGGPGGFPGEAPLINGQGPCPGQAAVEGTDVCPKKCSAGGGGGGNGGDGGDGGPVDCPMTDFDIVYDPGWGGQACGEAALIPLSGGSGGAGGTLVPNTETSHPGTGGGGGGAIQIVAGGSILLAFPGGISAGGGGGGETTSGGGAGGGAGGSILLEAVSIELEANAILAANGGGGGGGDCT